jgi:hypothetical protein
MSRGYRVVVEPLSTASKHVSASDALCIDVALLPILSPEDMRALLQQQLSQEGWQQAADGGREKVIRPGLVATLSADGSTVTIAMTAERDVGGSGRSDAAAKAAAEKNAAAAEAAIKREATTALAAAEADVRAALEQAIQKVDVDALEQKARSMGQVESIERGTAADGSLEITIKVRA